MLISAGLTSPRFFEIVAQSQTFHPAFKAGHTLYPVSQISP